MPALAPQARPAIAFYNFLMFTNFQTFYVSADKLRSLPGRLPVHCWASNIRQTQGFQNSPF